MTLQLTDAARALRERAETLGAMRHEHVEMDSTTEDLYGNPSERRRNKPGATFTFTEETPMLVVSRKRNEGVMIDDDVRIVIVDIRGDKIRLGIDAPKERIVHREEVYKAIKLVAKRLESPPEQAEPGNSQ